MANSSERPLGTSFYAPILDVRSSIAIPGVHDRTPSTVQTPSSMGHTFERRLLRGDAQPAGSRFPCGHLGRQSQSLGRVTRFTDCCFADQWKDPRTQDPDFRWKLFWDVIWLSGFVYIVLAETWLATETYFGLGAVAVRAPRSAGSLSKKSTPPSS